MKNANKINYITEEEILNNAEYNKKFLQEAEEELKQLKVTKGQITDGDISKVLGF